MDNEQFERQMAFIVEQQAKFSADLAARDAHAKKVDHQIEQLVTSMGILRDAVISLTRHVELHEQQIAEINRGMAELVERGKETDARLNALLLVVERHISGHQ
ncbi:MAG: hypothetical protein DMF60_18730 [Acidobacteria bacterium]|nr:MAG: hypothetical protein DMF60_18730 [Acidobacteriota bacterium]